MPKKSHRFPRTLKNFRVLQGVAQKFATLSSAAQSQAELVKSVVLPAKTPPKGALRPSQGISHPRRAPLEIWLSPRGPHLKTAKKWKKIQVFEFLGRFPPGGVKGFDGTKR